ncbi:hypothetical protein [Flavisolibacter ginsenosidimutans]|uniref:Nucleotidyl transferase AbiEii/AbiGii toxin family protein n=1 Tax=Flavisolibacter ginsenosidimutans TaxID=661481 RepID=A0A5B8UKV7_9BACT|nr:hypothetical protein [Flavisolibacter ginsenosidimutans]QEC57314.1 hypothetical protein FSB75_15875 [Flavisolibacter ginsenosidimutans]
MFEFFQNIIRFLNDNEIPYMLSGSVAMSIYIVPRATRDIDIVVAIRPGDVDTIIQQLGKEYYCDKEAIVDAVQRQS